MYYFKQKDLPVFYLVDIAGNMMITVVTHEHIASINQNTNQDYMKRTLDAYMLDNQAAPTYEKISEADFYKIYRDVQATIETNYELFELHHFGINQHK